MIALRQVSSGRHAVGVKIVGTKAYELENNNLGTSTVEFTGENFITVDRKAEKKAEVEDTTLRFRTTAISGLLFLAKSQRSLDTLELSLVGGQVRIFIRLGHYEKQMTIGQSLNDDFWHTITFKRRGNIIEAFIDDEEPKKGNTLLALTKLSLSQP